MAIPLCLTSEQLATAVSQVEGKVLPVRTLAKWAATRLLTPSVQWTHARRTPRLYSLRDMARARLILRLRAAGISMGKVRVILAELAAQDDLRELLSPNSRAVLEVQGWRVILHRRGQAKELPDGQLRLPLMGIVRGNIEAARAVHAVSASKQRAA